MGSIMIPVGIAPDTVIDYLNALRGWQSMTGVLVAVLYKQRTAALVDELTPRARRLNTINVIRKLADDRLQGGILDGVDLQFAVGAQGFQPAGEQMLLSDCSGVGNAIVQGLCKTGTRQLALYDQNPTIRQRPHDLLVEAFPAVRLSVLPNILHGVDLSVNGSSVGMAEFDELPLPRALLDTLDSATHVADIVTAPMMTPLLTLAVTRGCRMQAGPGMALARMTLMGQSIDAIPLAWGAAA